MNETETFECFYCKATCTEEELVINSEPKWCSGCAHVLICRLASGDDPLPSLQSIGLQRRAEREVFNAMLVDIDIAL